MTTEYKKQINRKVERFVKNTGGWALIPWEYLVSGDRIRLTEPDKTMPNEDEWTVVKQLEDGNGVIAEPDNTAARVKERAPALFNVYNSAGLNPWRTFDGRPVPPWADINDDVRAKWEAVAAATLDIFNRV